MSVTLVGIRFGVFTLDIMPLRLLRVAKTSMLGRAPLGLIQS